MTDAAETTPTVADLLARVRVYPSGDGVERDGSSRSRLSACCGAARRRPQGTVNRRPIQTTGLHSASPSWSAMPSTKRALVGESRGHPRLSYITHAEVSSP